MKKLLSVLLASLMLATLLLPLSVFAENGPAPTDWENITEEDLENLDDLNISLICVLDYEKEEMGYVYPAELASEAPVTTKGISYNKSTNTLTLTNFRSPYAVLAVAAMGDDFKIELVGYNELGSIVASALKWGCSISLEGSGELVINKKLAFAEAVSLDFSGVETGFFKAGNVLDLKIYGARYDEYGDLVYPAVSIKGAPSEEFSEVFILEGMECEKIVTERVAYFENIYEQEEFYYLGGFYAEEFFKRSSDGKLFAGNRIVEGNYATDYFTLYSLEYDEFLDVYLVREEKGLERVIPSKNGFVSYDERIETRKLALCDDEPQMMNIGYTADGEKCTFVEYYYDPENPSSGKGTNAYPIVEHPEFGMTVLGYTRGDACQVSEKTFIRERYYYDFVSYNSTITMNNGGTELPAKVKLKKATSAYGGVNVTWEQVWNASSYTVYRKAAGAKSWTTLGTSKTTSYLDTTAKTGTKYTYTVRAKNIVGLGAYDKTGVSTTYVAAPTVKIANASNGIKVSWNKISGATGYTVYRSQYSNGSWSGWKNMGTVKADKASWTDTSVKSGTQYRYTVRTVSGKLTSNFKATSGLVYLSTPTVKIANASTGVKVTWSKITGAKNYIVYRSEYTGGKWSGWKKISTVGAVTSTVDTTAKSGVNYKYTVKAVNGASTGAYKESAKLLYLSEPKTTISNASNGIKVSWTKSAGAKGYTVYRSEYVNGKWTGWKNMGTAKVEKSSWIDKSVVSGIQYKYTVRAVNGQTKSSYKATAGLVFLSPPTVKASIGSYKVNVTWSKVAGATEYKLYRADFKDGKWTSWAPIATLKADTTTYVDKTIVADSVYKYAVKPIRGASIGAYATDEVWYCYAPSISTNNTDTGVMVHWEDFNGAEQYILYRSEEKNGKWTEWKKVKTVKSNKEYWIDETVVAGVKYKYAIKAQRGDDKTPTGVSNERVYIETRYEF